MSRRRIVFLLTGFIAVVALSALWHFVAHVKMPEYTERLESRLSDALGMEVLVRGETDLKILPTLRASFSDVVVRDEKLELLAVKKLSMGLELLPLLRKRVRVTKLILEEPVLTIKRDESGTFNFEKAMRRKGRRIDPLFVRTASVVQGTLRFIDEVTGTRVEFAGLDMELGHLNRGKSGKLSFAAQIRAGRLLVNDIEMKDLSATVDAEEGMYRTEPFRVTAFGGEAKGTFSADLRQEQPSYRAVFSAERISLGKLYRDIIGKELLEGRVDVQADLSARGPGRIINKLDGRVNMAGNDIVLHGFNLDGFIEEFRKSQKLDLVDIGAYLFAGPVGALLTKSHDVAGMYRELKDGKSETLHEFVFNWKLENGRALTDDVAFRTKENRVAFQGAVDLPHRRYDGFTLGLLDKKGCAEITQEITGTLSEPSLKKPRLVQSLAGPLVNILQETVKIIDPEKCKPFYKGKVEHAKKESRSATKDVKKR